MTEILSQGIGVARPDGSTIDASNLHTLLENLQELSRKVRFIALDLSRVSFVDPSLLEPIMSTLRSIHAHGGELTACSLSEQVHGLAVLAKLDRIVPIVSTLQDAESIFLSKAGDPPSEN